MTKRSKAGWFSSDFDEDLLDDAALNNVAKSVEGKEDATAPVMKRAFSSPDGGQKRMQKLYRAASSDDALSKNRNLRRNASADVELWSEKHSPKSLSDLAIHPKKVEEVKRWLLSNRSQSVLLLSGPAGCGKTATLRAVARSLNYDVQEWTNPDSDLLESQSQAFERFISRSQRYAALPGLLGDHDKKLVVIEELPSVVLRDPHLLHSAVKRFNRGSVPLVIVHSVEAKKDSMRTLFPPHVLSEVTNVSFNPVATTALVKTLTTVAMLESSYGARSFRIPDKAALTSLATAVNGDVRAAINALQFSCLNDVAAYDGIFHSSTTLASSSSARKRDNPAKKEELSGSIGVKDPSIDLFHAIGKVLYCKRGQESPPEELCLPERLKAQARKSLLTSPEELLDSIPMSNGSFVAFLHQSYPSFFPDIHSLSKVAESLSFADPFFQEWTSTGKVSLTEFGGLVAVRALCHSNPHPVKLGAMRTFKKPESFTAVAKAKENLPIITGPFAGCGLPAVEIATTMAPMVGRMFVLENEPDGFCDAVHFFRVDSSKRRPLAAAVETSSVDNCDVESLDFLIEESDDD